MALTKTPIELSSTPSIVDGGNATAITIDSSEDVTLAGELKFADSKKAIFGAGSDLQIYHDGNNSYIADAGDGELLMRSNTIAIQNAAGTENSAKFIENGAVQLYHNDAKKFETTATGITITSDGNSEGITVAHSNGNTVAQLIHNGSGDEGALKLYDSNSVTVQVLGETGQNSYFNSGNVGFGTNSPNDIVDIHKNHSQLRLTDTDDSKFVQFSYSGGKLIARNNSTNTTTGQFTLTEDGNFGVRLTSPTAPIHTDVGAPSSADKTLAIFQSESTRQSGFGWDDSISSIGVGSVTNHDLCLKTHIASGNTTRARFRVSTNTSYTPDGIFGGSATPHTIGTTGSGELLLGYNDNGSGLYSASMALSYDAIDGLNNTAYVNGFLMRDTGNSTTHLIIETDGDVKNTNNSYGSLSDSRIKKDIADASSQWDDIKALKIRKYKLATQPAPYNEQFQIGVIAQELEAAGMSGLIKESDPDTKHLEYDPSLVGEKVKSVKYSVLYMKAIKALQEAMIKIEALEARVTTLEG